VIYHTRFEHFHPRTIAATRRLVKANPWRAPRAEQRRLAQQWIDECAAVYGLQRVPQLTFANQESCGHGFYVAGHIVLPYFSLTSLLHEFRHAMQRGGLTHLHHRRANRDALEDDARAWSLSLFYTVAPRRFRTMVMSGRVLFVEPEDLLA